jgi:hypothetical protein
VLAEGQPEKRTEHHDALMRFALATFPSGTHT